jgi:hypothetical protein
MIAVKFLLKRVGCVDFQAQKLRGKALFYEFWPKVIALVTKQLSLVRTFRSINHTHPKGKTLLLHIQCICYHVVNM